MTPMQSYGTNKLHIRLKYGTGVTVSVSSKILNKTHLIVTDTWHVVHWAAFNGHLKIIERLMQRDASVASIKTERQYRALMLAAEFGHVECMKQLLTYKIVKEKIDEEHKYGGTALIFASDQGQEICV